MVDSKRNMWIGLGAVGAFVAAALVWHYVSADDEEDATPQVSNSEFMADLEKQDLINVKRNENGLDPTYFIRLLQYIGKTNKERTAGTRDKLTKQRRVHYEKENWEEYEALVK